MTTREELFLRAISSFVEEDGFAHFTFNNLTTICKSDHFKKYLDSLIEQGHLEDFTENGYCKKMKVNTQLDCPDFIFNPEFDIRMLDYLLERWDEYTQGTPLQRKGKCVKLYKVRYKFRLRYKIRPFTRWVLLFLSTNVNVNYGKLFKFF